MSIEQESIINGAEPAEPKTGADLYEQVYPRPVDGESEQVIRPDVDEDSLGYN